MWFCPAPRDGERAFRSGMLAEAAKREAGNVTERARYQNGETARRKTAEICGTTILSHSDSQ